MLFSIFVLVSWFGAAAAQDIYPLSGSDACPCIDIFTNADVNRTWHNATCPLLRDNDLCYPALYGSDGCRLYDQTFTPECSSASPPSWCSSRFCYIDPRFCLRPNHPSEYFGSDGAAIHFSYETCGQLDSFRRNKALSHLNAIKSLGSLRVRSRLP